MHINASAIEKVVLFGDSLMAGYGLPNEHHLSVVLEDDFKKDASLDYLDALKITGFFLFKILEEKKDKFVFRSRVIEKVLEL